MSKKAKPHFRRYFLDHLLFISSYEFKGMVSRKEYFISGFYIFMATCTCLLTVCALMALILISINLLLGLFGTSIHDMIGTEEGTIFANVLKPISCILLLYVLFITLVMMTKRMRDADRSPWRLLGLIIIPIGTCVILSDLLFSPTVKRNFKGDPIYF